MILIGSRAIKHYFPTFRNPKDIDLIATPIELEAWIKRNKGKLKIQSQSPKGRWRFEKTDGTTIEIELIEEGSSNELIAEYVGSLHSAQRAQAASAIVDVAPPLLMLAIKRSHLHRRPAWRKNVQDYHWLKERLLGADPFKESVPDDIWKIFRKRKKEATKRWPDKAPQLNVENEKFFRRSRSVGRVFEHDDLHRASCYYDEPLFLRCKRDKSKAWIERDLFEQLSHQDQMRMFKEEAFAIALERWVIPAYCRRLTSDDQLAYLQAVEYCATRLFRNRWQNLLIENYPEIAELDHDYVGSFLQALLTGKISLKEAA